jgi:hypothetical protein
MTSNQPSRQAGSPTFLVIGAARSGSTYLTRALSEHPQVLICEPKEPHFLAFAPDAPSFTGPGDAETINRFSIVDETKWRSLFPAKPGVTHYGDGSVSTLYFHEAAIRNIRQHCPEVKMIVILRDPVERAFSAFQYWTSRGHETESFSRALDIEDERISSGFQHIWHYARMGLYSEQLRPFIEEFGNDRLLILCYEKFMADKAAGLQQCSDFLGLDDFPELELEVEVNAGGAQRNNGVTFALRVLRRIPPVNWAVKSVVPWRLRERLRSSTLTHSEISETDRSRLEEFFSAERTALAELLGDAAPPWTRS